MSFLAGILGKITSLISGIVLVLFGSASPAAAPAAAGALDTTPIVAGTVMMIEGREAAVDALTEPEPEPEAEPKEAPAPQAEISSDAQRAAGEAQAEPTADQQTVILPPTAAEPEEQQTSNDAPQAEEFAFDPAWRDAVVNLVCESRYGSTLITGSGVLIDPRGVIVTNAHVAKYFLFADWPSPSLFSCVVRVGSPAYPLYRAALLHMPEAWVKDAVETLYTIDDRTVYGRKDYALLLISGTTNPARELPEAFPYLPVYANTLPLSDSFVYITAYAADMLGRIVVLQGIHQLSSPARVAAQKPIEGETQPSVISFRGNINSQHGSSGGAVIAAGGSVAAIPTFFDRNPGARTSDRVLNAIGMEYVSRDLSADTGYSLEEFLARDNLRAVSDDFLKGKGAEYQRLYVEAWRQKQDVIVPGVSY